MQIPGQIWVQINTKTITIERDGTLEIFNAQGDEANVWAHELDGIGSSASGVCHESKRAIESYCRSPDAFDAIPILASAK